MRYQEPIYIQNENEGVRNKDILNVNMSSDMCIFVAPTFSMSGASKITCSGSTGTTYVVSTASTIPVSFHFTGNVSTFSATNATFKYEVYKYNNSSNIFIQPPIIKSSVFSYSSFSGTNVITENLSINNLGLDGEYLIKGYFQFSACTNFLAQLGKTVDTLTYINGKQYGLYDNDLDYYFIAFKSAEKPTLLTNGSNTPVSNQLFQQVIIPTKDQSVFIISQGYSGFFIFTLNGLVLAPNYDFTYSGSVVTLLSPTKITDVVTITYTTTGGNTLVGDNISITTPVVSGTTNNQGSNSSYFNTTTGKYEIYTVVTPATNGSIMVMLNGVTLASGVDYYQSSSNPKRIILEGDLRVGDLLTIVYFPSVTVINGLITSNPTVSWSINTPPQLINGIFTLEVSNYSSFSSITSSHSQNYVVGKTGYVDGFVASGAVGTNLYYRVKNQKKYVTLCGDILTDTAYSDIIPIVIQSNSINTY